MSERGEDSSLPMMGPGRRAKSADPCRSRQRAQSAKSTRSAIETVLPTSQNAVSRAVYLRRLNILMSQKEDNSNLQRSATPNSFGSSTRMKQVPLPQVRNSSRTGTGAPRNMKNVSISGDRYLGSSKTGRQNTQSSLHKSYPQYDAPSLPKKEQVHRFEEEQTNLYITRTMKRKSEILSHRVDRLYYLCGSGFPVQGRYEVSDVELQKLREFSRVRNNSRATSGRSRSVHSLTESSLLTESRGKRSPLGSPLGSPRCTPVPPNIDLTVEGSGVTHSGDKVKGHAVSNQSQSDGTQQAQMSSRIQDGNTINEDGKKSSLDSNTHNRKAGDSSENENSSENQISGASRTEHSSEEQHASPHRTRETERDAKDRTECKKDSGHVDRQNGKLGGRSDGEALKVDGQGAASRQLSTGGDGDGDANKECRNGEGTVVGGGGDAAGVSGGPESSGDAIQDSDGCQGDGDNADGCQGDDDGANGRHGDGQGHDDADSCHGDGEDELEEVEGREGGDDALNRLSSSDAIQELDGQHGDEDKEECQDKVLNDGEESVTSKHPVLGERQVESIAPGLKLDKTPCTMKKSDVYLTDFGDPKAPPSSDRDGKPIHSYGREIAQLERKLDKVDTLTQEVDDIGQVTRVNSDVSDWGNDGNQEGDYESGVFARARSDEERRKALQRREERKEAKNAVKVEQSEAQRVRDKAEKERALKQARKIKFKMEDVYNFISSRQREIFSQKFRELDSDGNGKITLKELTKKMHSTTSKDDIRHLLKVFDLNKDKTVDQREFVTVAALNDKLTGKEVTSEAAPLELNLNRLSVHITAYKEMFDVVDQNGDGRLAMDEIMFIITVSTGIDIAVDKEAVRYIHSTIDKDGNGSIDFVEYLAFIPFFQKIHQQIIGKPVTFDEIEEARRAVKKAMNR
ncbi:uncharacterized protein LOC121407952 isoform X2 [Lytechinus variegatus]|uniref:uncharacterized protein LOC121407952 isoform X2 n=1 Tax=Lytechinus variegatus TaxID=7654 RepID=UPI001BB27B9E|nr:uncharacterized protein LOC121407952 isoform X2 [Lytechinus variegatus]